MTATEQARDLLVRLLDAGVTDVVVAPGSRSGPLARAAAAADAQGRLRLHVRIDEREAGFLALGLAIALALLLDLKARREEIWLRDRYPGYAEYALHTKRFVPGLY